MLVESIIRRPEGTVATFADGAAYIFRPDETGRHVCEVPDNSPHLARLLDIAEGYRPAPRPASAPVAPPATPAAAAAQGQGMEDDPGSQGSQQAATTDDDTASAEQQAGDEGKGGAGAPVDPAAERTALQAAYTEAYGRPPHYRMSTENLRKAIDTAKGGA